MLMFVLRYLIKIAALFKCFAMIYQFYKSMKTLLYERSQLFKLDLLERIS